MQRSTANTMLKTYLGLKYFLFIYLFILFVLLNMKVFGFLFFIFSAKHELF